MSKLANISHKNVTVSKKKKILRIIVTVILCVILLTPTLILPAVSAIVYHVNFSQRYETAEWMAFTADDFPGLNVTECRFPSDHGQMLAGYEYRKGEGEPKGVLILAHGLGGGGQASYVNVIDYFAGCGYIVFAYDATGNDKSEGSCIGGFPQGVIDLDHAIRHVKARPYGNLPIVLYGHSWGGYSVCAVLEYHPDVRGVVSVAGCNDSTIMIREQGRLMAGDIIDLLIPYVALYEKIRFGSYADASAMKGFEESDAKIIILHSDDDTTVLPAYGYDIYKKHYGSNDRFTFLRFKDRGHSYLCTSPESAQYRAELNEQYKAYIAENGLSYSEETKQTFMNAHLDKEKCFELDAQLMEQLKQFYDICCE